MKALRSSPFRLLVLASALQLFIFSCWLLPVLLVEPELFDRHLDMKALRSSPVSCFEEASALQLVILACWLFSAWANGTWAASAASAADTTSHVERLIPTPLRAR